MLLSIYTPTEAWERSWVHREPKGCAERVATARIIRATRNTLYPIIGDILTVNRAALDCAARAYDGVRYMPGEADRIVTES